MKTILTVIALLLSFELMAFEITERKKRINAKLKRDNPTEFMDCKKVRYDISICVNENTVCIRWHNGYGSSMQCKFKEKKP